MKRGYYTNSFSLMVVNTLVCVVVRSVVVSLRNINLSQMDSFGMSWDQWYFGEFLFFGKIKDNWFFLLEYGFSLLV
jgi:hypothetical protein